MVSQTDKLFREYATRVSFNLSLSRNQCYALWSIGEGTVGRKDLHQQFGCLSDNFVSGSKWLSSHGLSTWTDPTTMKPPWSQPPHQLTEAGRHVLALLRIAGLVPLAAANDAGTATEPKVKKVKKR